VTGTVPSELDLLAWRLTDGLRLPSDTQDPTAAGHGRMLSALAVAHATGKRSACCWLRVRPGGQVALLLGGGVTPLGAPVAGPQPLEFPAGSRGVPVDRARMDSTLKRLAHWTELVIGFRPPEEDDGGLPGPALEDLFALMPQRAMAVAAVATPLRPQDVAAELDEISDQVDRLQAHASGRGVHRLEFDTAVARLRYLETWSALGLWSMRVWVGASDEPAGRGVAGLLANAADLRSLPVVLRPAKGAPSRASVGAPGGGGSVGSDAIAAVMRCPVRELPGVRLTAASDFDVNPETAGELTMGQILDSTRAPCLPFTVSLASVNRHVFVTGATGSGKSQSVRALLDQLSAAKVPWLVIEPAKAEYARLAGRVETWGAKLTVIRPGAVAVPPASLNPLEPSSIVVGNPPRREFFRLQTHLDLVRALFTASFQAEEPFPQILARALTMSYEERGWNVALGRATEGDPAVRPRFPYLDDLQRCARKAVDAVEYGTEVRNNVRGFVDVRLGSLRLGTSGRFFEDGHPLDLEALLRTNVVFEIEDLGDDNDKAFFIGTVLIRLFEVLRLYEQHGLQPVGLRHVTVIEEAHRLLRNVSLESAAGHAVTMFADLLAEVRAYGEGIVVAEQIPAKIIPDVVKNSAVKLVHRLPSADDREFVGATMNLSEEQSKAVVALLPGVAAGHVDGMDNPVLVAVDASRSALETRKITAEAAPTRVRSSSCPATCGTDPCSFEGLVESAELAASPEVTLWAEIVTLAHLMGEPAGSLQDFLRARLEGLPSERMRCAVGVAATRSVRTRSRYIRRFYDSFALERRIAEAMSKQMTAGVRLERPDPQWQIAHFRWADVRRAMDAEPDEVKHSPDPYRLPPEAAKRGLALRGGTWAELRASLRSLDLTLKTSFDKTFIGDPPLLDETAAELGTGDTRIERLDSALKQVLTLPTKWPSYRLYPANEGIA